MITKIELFQQKSAGQRVYCTSDFSDPNCQARKLGLDSSLTILYTGTAAIWTCIGWGWEKIPYCILVWVRNVRCTEPDWHIVLFDLLILAEMIQLTMPSFASFPLTIFLSDKDPVSSIFTLLLDLNFFRLFNFFGLLLPEG